MTAERPSFSAAELASIAVDHNPRRSFGTETPDIVLNEDDEIIIDNLYARPCCTVATAFVIDESDKDCVAGIDAKSRLNLSLGGSMVSTIEQCSV